MPSNGKEQEPKVRKEEEIKAPLFAGECKKKLDELGTNMMQVAAKAEMQYDTIRKACKGVEFAGNKVLPVICDALGLDIEEMRKLIKYDKIIQLGGIHEDMLKELIDPYLMKISPVFEELSQHDKVRILKEIQRTHDEKRGS